MFFMLVATASFIYYDMNVCWNETIFLRTPSVRLVHVEDSVN